MDFLLPLVALVLVAGVFWFRRGLIFLFLANRAFTKKDDAKVLHWFGRAWKIRQLSPSMVATYSYQLLKNGATEEAGELLDTFASQGYKRKPLKPQDSNLIQTYQSLVLWKQGRLDDAIAVLRGLKDSGYHTSALYGNLGYFLIEKGDLDAAEAFCLEARDWSPNGKVILDNLGSVWLKKGNLTQAAEVYEALTALEPKFPEAWYGAACVALQLDNPETAAELLEHALTLPFNALSTVSRETVQKALDDLPKSEK